MPKPTKGPRLGGGPAHERLMLANLAAALFTHKSIKTTETKAKRLRPFAERLVTFAKRGDLHSRRRVLAIIGDKTVVHELFTQIAPLVAERNGGYTRITKLGYRKGDNAPMAQIELVLEPVTSKVKKTTPSPAKKTETAQAKKSSPEIVAEETVTGSNSEGADAQVNAEEAPAATAVEEASVESSGEPSVDETEVDSATKEAAAQSNPDEAGADSTEEASTDTDSSEGRGSDSP